MPIVKMPDGQLVEMPDQLSAEQRSALEAKLKESQSGGAARAGKLVASDVLQGLAGLPALAIDVAGYTKEKLDSLPRAITERVTGQQIPHTPYRFGQQMEGVKGGAEALFGVKPETEGEKWRSVVTQGAAGGLVGPGAAAAPVRSMVAGAAGAAGSEGSARLFGDNALSRILGGLVGGTAGGMAANKVAGVNPRIANLATQATEGFTQQQLDAAAAFMKKSAAQGVNIDLAQALEATAGSGKNLSTIRDILANNRAGNRVQETLRGQPTQVELLADTTMAKVPGTVTSQADAANRVAETATKVVNNAKTARSAAVKPLYEQAGELSPAVRKAMIDEVMDVITAPGATAQTVEKGKAVVEMLKSAPSTSMPMSHALDFDSLIGNVTGAYKGTPLTPADPKTTGQLKNLAGRLNNLLQAASPELKAAESRFAQISQDVVDPLKQGPVGQLATPRGYRPDVQANMAKLEGMLNRGTDPQAASSDILTLGRQLNKVDKNAFQDAVKTYLSGKVSAIRPTLGGNTAGVDEAADVLYNGLFKDRKQWQGVKDAATAIAEANNLAPRDVIRGLENFGQIVQAATKRPKTVGGLRPEEVMQMGGATNAANVLRIFGFLPMERAARKLEDAALARTFSEFDKILTTPEGVKMLAELSKHKPISAETATILAGYAGASTQALPNPDQVTRP